MVSLLKAWYGDYAVKENEYGYQWLPKLGGNESLTVTIERAKKGEVDGLLVFGQNIAVTNPNTGWGRAAIRNLKWLVVCDLFENETASVWYADPNGPKPSEVQTEVFYLPTNSCLEKDGSVNNTERLMQWHDRIKAAPGECRSDAWWTYQLGKRLKALAESSGLPRDEGLRSLTWSYDVPQGKQNEMGLPPIEGDCDLDAVAFEMNGFDTATGRPVQGSSELKSDGTTACGCRLLAGFINEAGENLTKRRDGGTVDHEIDLTYRFAWPTNSRILYNRCSAAPDGHPWSERKKLVWWDEHDRSGSDMTNRSSTQLNRLATGPLPMPEAALLWTAPLHSAPTRTAKPGSSFPMELKKDPSLSSMSPLNRHIPILFGARAAFRMSQSSTIR